MTSRRTISNGCQWVECLLFANKAVTELCSSVSVWMLPELEHPASTNIQKQLGSLRSGLLATYHSSYDS